MPQTTIFKHNHVRVAIQPNIGLDAAARHSVVEILNLLLADEAVLSLKTYRADGHGGGTGGPDLQALFDAQYKQINTISNEIMERVQILGGSHSISSEELIDLARLDGNLDAVPGIMSILADQETYIRFLREDTRKCSEEYEDEGTFEMLVGVLRLHEKMAWILRSYVENKPIHGESQKGIV